VAETKRRDRDGSEPVWKRSRCCFWKRPEHRTDPQTGKLSELGKDHRGTVRASRLREAFPRLWASPSPAWAGKFLAEGRGRVRRWRREPMKQVARTIRTHRPLLRHWFRARGEVSAGAVEGLNTKGKLGPRKSYGFRNAEVANLALLCYTTSVIFPSQNAPTDSADEAVFLTLNNGGSPR
jgi:transposase